MKEDRKPMGKHYTLLYLLKAFWIDQLNNSNTGMSRCKRNKSHTSFIANGLNQQYKRLDSTH